MFKELFDTIKLKREVKIKTEALRTARTNAQACLELLDHPLRHQGQIRKLLKEIEELWKE